MYDRIKFFLILNPLYSYAETETQEEKPKNVEELIYHELDNETLLQQTQSLYHDTSNTFLAHMRGLSNNELLLEDARTESDQFQIPTMPVLATDKTKSLESAKLKVKYVKERLDAYQKQLELIQAEQTLLDNHIDLVKKAEIETKVFEDTIDSLKLPLYEISLRIQDGTLSEEKVP